MGHQDFIVHATADNWHGNSSRDEETLFPSIEVIFSLIESLNARDRTIVSVVGRDGSFLTIGGGSGQYVVFASTSDENLWNLHSGRIETEDTIPLTIGGQEGNFSPCQIADREMVANAVRSFFLDGRLQPSGRWEKQS
jgi:hypothetical protein